MSVRTFKLCPICQDPDVSSSFLNMHDVYKIECRACGSYLLESFVVDLNLFEHKGTWWDYPRRQALAHKIRTRRDVPIWSDLKRPYINRHVVSDFEKSGIFLPNRLEQLDNAVRFLAASEIANGIVPSPLSHWGLWAVIGTLNSIGLGDLLRDMKEEGLVAPELVVNRTEQRVPIEIANARLSLRGWRRWGELTEGATRSSNGFIAMQFGDARLDAFIRDVIQAGVKAELGVEVRRVDSPDVVRAGLIDNIMREAIEDAAFVLVELSHGNRGAYWEAGLAEGLGKPVIYLCEQAVWDNPSPEQKVHFDVRHRTTVMWNDADPEPFVKNLIATIKNSLRLIERKEKAG